MMRTVVNAGCEARRRAATPAAVAKVHAACPSATPAAVKTPARRPEASTLRIVSAVSWPGVTITSVETARNSAKCPNMSGEATVALDFNAVVREPLADQELECRPCAATRAEHPIPLPLGEQALGSLARL